MSPRLGAALSGHWLPLDAILRLAVLADEIGLEALFVDGDETVLDARGRAPLYDGAALSQAALHATRRLRVGAIHLPGFAHPVLLARNFATQQLASGGRALAFFGAGAGRKLARLGLALSPGERIDWLDETLAVLRSLFAGEEVSAAGRHVRLERVRSAAADPPPPLIVAAAGPRALRLAARRADILDANVPPLPECVAPLRAQLGRSMETWIWVFARPDAAPGDALAAYRKLCPWFAGYPAERLERALLCGDPARWPSRLAELASELGVDLPIVDLSGLDEGQARRALLALAPAKRPQMS
jgi:alkanesulfonate monooxygenase SsuD/methylene tetrahydromethanopterin reductase-like flavin-dependent oxidoreductase (luciferase family)